MTALKVIMFLVGVIIVLAGLSLMMIRRVEIMRSEGQTIEPGWAALLDSLARFWSQFIGGVGEEYRTGFTVLVVGVFVMVLPLALPKPRG